MVLERHWLLSIFVENLHKSVAQITMYYHLSEDVLHLHFAVDQFHDMIWKTEECCVTKNIELKICW